MHIHSPSKDKVSGYSGQRTPSHLTFFTKSDMEFQQHTYKFCPVNWVRTPDLLQLWGFKTSACCKLCPSEKCTLHHILSNCPTALKQKRYTWRHDSVLYHIKAALTLHISSQSKHFISQNKKQLIFQSFVKAGSTLSSLCREKAPQKKTN